MKPGGDLWFWHVLALALGKTVSELQAVMTVRELESWRRFYRVRPFDDLHRFHRPAALIAHSFGGGDHLEETLRILVGGVREEASAEGEFSEADKATLRALTGG
ncbi:hypothetical protein [Alcaligenes endophyticus]|uniref:Phage tail assembly chaperone n=1 Tax=Alcaligenes endophyticus TaxID=1929088 RepID=A0ABT8ENR4_9BURK|nr:hypothetical protein [Alcaligenes endophyticus]MCX5592795.1 hypothetical protein [Alcaligenes endophyticus]MDN4122837.1 hypothetical protein [Alcaligenes endophyticus]